MTDQGPIVSQSDKRTPDVVERLGADHPLKQLGAFEYELRTYMGHTNYAVVQTRLDEASAVLNRSLPATAGADLYPAPEKYNRGGEDCTGSTSSDGASAMQEAIAEMDRFDRYSPDIARADREAAFRKAVSNLVIAARTTGGVAGRDEGLCQACDAVEAFFAITAKNHSASERASRTVIGDILSRFRDGTLDLQQAIQAILDHNAAASKTLSPDTARADREAIERGVRFYCRGYVHDSHGEDRIYFSGILISGLVDAIADALSKGGGTTEGSQG